MRQRQVGGLLTPFQFKYNQSVAAIPEANGLDIENSNVGASRNSRALAHPSAIGNGGVNKHGSFENRRKVVVARFGKDRAARDFESEDHKRHDQRNKAPWLPIAPQLNVT
jgi:hypothetical protein